VQVDPGLTLAWFQFMSIKYDEPLSKFAFNCNLRHCNGDLSQARFNSPFGCACDADGGIYIADQHNHVIRKLMVGRCRVDPGFTQLTLHVVSKLETKK